MAKKAKATGNATEKKARKPYPSYQERIDAADVKIEKLQKLIAERSDLIDKTAKLLAERTETLSKNQEQLEKTIAKRERLVNNMNRAASGERVRLTPEEAAEKRRAAITKRRDIKRAEKQKVETLMNALRDRGQTIDDLLESLNK